MLFCTGISQCVHKERKNKSQSTNLYARTSHSECWKLKLHHYFMPCFVCSSYLSGHVCMLEASKCNILSAIETLELVSSKCFEKSSQSTIFFHMVDCVSSITQCIINILCIDALLLQFSIKL